jgi:hypothetical protein
MLRDGANEGRLHGRRSDARTWKSTLHDILPGEQSRRLSTRLTLRPKQHLQRRAVIATWSSPTLARKLGGFGWKVRRTCRQP